jgi:Transposase DDE domain
MTLADQAAMTGHDGQVTEGQLARPKRRTFTAAYKARILAAFDALPEGSPERGELLRRERLYHSHLEHWRGQQHKGALPATTGKPAKNPEADELTRLRAENRKLKARNEKLESDLGKTRTALDIAGKAFAPPDGHRRILAGYRRHKGERFRVRQAGRDKNPGPFPQVRLVGLGECGTHAIVAARMGTARANERELAEELIGTFEPGMLIIADRGFYSYHLWKAAQESGADLLWRMQDGPNLPVVRTFPDGSCESFLIDPKVRSRRNGQRYYGRPVDEPTGIPVRVVEYEVTNREGSDEIFCLITTISDPAEADAAELAGAYAERWEFESGLDELKTHQRGRGAVLRSKSPEMVRQEIWALLLTHYAIRHLMREAADQADVDPDRLSFMRSLRVVRRQVTGQAGFSPLTADGCS